MYENGLISEEEYNDLKANLFRVFGVKPSNKSKNKIGLLWFFNIFNFTGILTNIIVALAIEGRLRYMYEGILYGFIAGFCFIAVSVPFIISISSKLKEYKDKDKSVKNAIIGGRVSIVVTTLLMILSIFL